MKRSEGGGEVVDSGERLDEMERKKEKRRERCLGGGIKRHLNAGGRGGWERKDCEGIAH